MPAKSIAQQRFMGLVKSVQDGKAKASGKAKKAAKEMKPKDVDDFASTKHKGLPKRVKQEEAAKRDYKAEYKKFQSSPKMKKYRAELNAYNRKKGTYGNGDKKDASHKGGKIAGFEEQSKNRGRREKSRLKKEEKLKEIIQRLVREALPSKSKGSNPSAPISSATSLKGSYKKHFEDEELQETTVRLSTMKDASFEPGRFVQIVGKKGMVKLDKKSVHTLAKMVRQSRDAGMGYSFTAHEGKINESKVHRLPNGVKVKIEFKGLTFDSGRSKPVFLDRAEMLTFFKATTKYLK